MAKRFTFRIDSEGVDTLKRQLEALGPAGQKAFEQIKQSSPQLANALDRAEQQADRTRAALERAKQSTDSFGAAAGTLRNALGTLGVAVGVNEIVSFGIESLKAAGRIGDLSQQLGIGTRALQVYQFAATQMGISQGELETSLGRLTRSIGEAADGNRQAQEAFARLGIGIYDVSGRLRSTESVALEMADALQRIKDPAARAALEVDLLGRAGQKMDAIFASGRAAIEAFAAEAERLGVVLSQEEIAKADDAADKIELLGFRFQKLGQTIATYAAPPLSDLLDDLDRLLTKGPEIKDLFEFSLLGFLTRPLRAGSDKPQAVPGVTPNATVEIPAGFFGGSGAGPFGPPSAAQLAADRTRQALIEQINAGLERQMQLAAMAGQQARVLAAGDAAVQKAAADAQQKKIALSEADLANIRAQAEAIERQKIAREADSKAAAEAQRISEQAVAAAKREAEAQTQRLTKARDAVEAQIEGLKEENYQLGLTDKERFVRNELLKAEAQIKQGLVKDGPAYLRQVEQEAAALWDHRQAIQAATDADRARTEEAKRQAAERQRAAAAEAELLIQPFKHASDRIQDAFSDMWMRIFDRDISSVGDFFDEVVGIAKQAAAQIAAALVFRPVLGGVLNAVGLSGIAQQFGFGGGSTGVGGASSLLNFGNGMSVANIGNQLLGGSALGGIGNFLFGGQNIVAAGKGVMGVAPGLLGTGSSFLADSFLPVVGSFALPLLMGGSLKDAAFSGGGAALGAGIGSIVPGIGTALGAALGGLAGSLLGGLFGSKPPKQKSITPITVGSGGLFETGDTFTKHSGDVTGKVGQAAADQLNAILGSIGGTLTGPLSGGQPGTNLIQYYGRTPRFMSVVSGVNRQFGDDEQAAQQAIADFVARTLIEAVSENKLAGVSDTIKTVIARSGATDTQTLQAAIAFGQLYDSLTKVEEPATQASQALKALEDQFKAAKREAETFGLALEPLDQGLARAKRKIAEDFNASVADAILAITDPLALALKQQAAAAEQRLKEARDAGADLVQVEKLNALERQKVIEQVGRQTTDSIRALFDQAMLGPLSALSPEQQLFQAKGRFGDVVREAAAGSLAALGDLPAAAQNYLEVARGFFASTEAYARIFGEVTDALRQFGNIPGFAAGGTAQGWAWVGERGPELAYFERPTAILDSASSRALVGANDVRAWQDGFRAVVETQQRVGQRIIERLERIEARLAGLEQEAGLSRAYAMQR